MGALRMGDWVISSGSTALDMLAAGMANALADAPTGLATFNVDVEHPRGYEWLSRDTAGVYAYVADPWCGWDVPAAVIPALFAPAAQIADPAVLARILSYLPVLIASGDADPLAGGEALIELLGKRIPLCRYHGCDGQAVPGRTPRNPQ